MKKLRIFFVHDSHPSQTSTFVRNDLDFLRRKYAVRVANLGDFQKRFRGPLSSTATWRNIQWSDLVFGWFGGTSPIILMGSLLRKPSIIIAGGADVVSIPEIQYGLNPNARLRYYISTLGLKLATRVLLFSDASRRSLEVLPGIRKERLSTLYLGIDTDHFRPAGIKRPHALTIGYLSPANMRRKGYLTFVRAAHLCPEITYRIGGNPIDSSIVDTINQEASQNLKYLGYLSDERLLTEYQEAKVYAQLSIHEGFGLSLAEAMACECVPVVTDRGSIPEVVGDTGTYVPVNDPQSAAEAITQAIFSDTIQQGRWARERIVELFRPQNRQVGLQEAIESICQT